MMLGAKPIKLICLVRIISRHKHLGGQVNAFDWVSQKNTSGDAIGIGHHQRTTGSSFSSNSRLIRPAASPSSCNMVMVTTPSLLLVEVLTSGKRRLISSAKIVRNGVSDTG